MDAVTSPEPLAKTMIDRDSGPYAVSVSAPEPSAEPAPVPVPEMVPGPVLGPVLVPSSEHTTPSDPRASTLDADPRPAKWRYRGLLLRGIQRISSSSSLNLTGRPRPVAGPYPTRTRASLSCISFSSGSSGTRPFRQTAPPFLSSSISPISSPRGSSPSLPPSSSSLSSSTPFSAPSSSASSLIISTLSPAFEWSDSPADIVAPLHEQQGPEVPHDRDRRDQSGRPAKAVKAGKAGLAADLPVVSHDSAISLPLLPLLPILPLLPTSRPATVPLPAQVKAFAPTRRLAVTGGGSWAGLPYEVRLQILHHLSYTELIRVSRVSRAFSAACFDGQLWTSLSASDFYHIIPAKALARIVANAGPFLRHLCLRGCVQMEQDGGGVDCIVRACHNLIRVNLEGCRNLRPHTMEALVANNRDLASLNLTGLPTVTDRICETIASSCPLLESLNLSWCQSVTTAGVRKVVLGCRQLRDLRVGEVAGFDQPDLAVALFRTNTLDRLVLSGCMELTDDVLRTMLHGRLDPELDLVTGLPMVPPRRLRHLDLSRCIRLSSVGVSALGLVCPDLETLILSGCIALTDDGLEPILASSRHLRYLSLDNLANLTNQLFSDHLARSPCAPNLSYLALSYCERVDDQGLRPVLEACTGLRTLELDNTAITNACLSQAAALAADRSGRLAVPGTRPAVGLYLEVYDCPNVTWTGIRHVLWRNAVVEGQAEVVALKCFHGYQMTVDEHMRRVLRGDRAAAMRLERKWGEYMQASEEAGVSGTGLRRRRRRRRAREAQIVHQDEQGGSQAGSADLFDLAAAVEEVVQSATELAMLRRRGGSRAGGGGCAVM